MSRKKKLLILAAIALLFLADFLYWTVHFSFEKALPDENWTKAQLWYYDEHFDMREILLDEADLGQVVTSLKGGQVTNRPRFRTLSQPYFQLYLYSDKGYPTSITIVENGDISIAEQLDTDHRKYFDGGEELFAILKGLMGRSPAVFPTLPS